MKFWRDERNEDVMTPDELRAASRKLGALIAVEAGIKVGAVASRLGVSVQKSTRLLEGWRRESACRWRKETA